MWRLLALLLLAAPAVAQTVTIDLGALDDLRQRRPRQHLVVQTLKLLRLEAPSPLPISALPDLMPRQSDTARALLAVAVSGAAAVLALPMTEPPRPVRARPVPILLARFTAAAPIRTTPSVALRIEPVDAPRLDAARLLLPFAPELAAPQLKDPFTLRETISPVLTAFPLLDRVPMLALDLPQLAIASSLQFLPATASLDETSRTTLDLISERLDQEKSRRAQLLVSLRTGDDPDAARRLAFARMLTVRAYLISHGIPASRLDARAVVAARGDEAVRITLSN